jgi:two-component system response regulator YesN
MRLAQPSRRLEGLASCSIMNSSLKKWTSEVWMRYIGFYDGEETTARELMGLELWSKLHDLRINTAIMKNTDELQEYIKEERPNIMVMVVDNNSQKNAELMDIIARSFAEIETIVIGVNEGYDVVRGFFVSGVRDYLLRPVDRGMFENAIFKAYSGFGMEYVVGRLKPEFDALIENIAKGGGEEELIIGEIFDHIYTDWDNDLLNCQIIADRAKYYMYDRLLDRKPWMEKFLYRNDFMYDCGFSMRSREELQHSWVINFKEAGAIERKYEIIDDRRVYKIGKYVIINVDDRLTLDVVARNVYLNPSYISHIFKKVTGINFTEFMTEVKIDRAKVLLRNEELRIRDVSATVGYGNQEYFSRIFKERTGYTPVDYRAVLAERYMNI